MTPIVLTPAFLASLVGAFTVLFVAACVGWRKAATGYRIPPWLERLANVVGYDESDALSPSATAAKIMEHHQAQRKEVAGLQSQVRGWEGAYRRSAENEDFLSEQVAYLEETRDTLRDERDTLRDERDQLLWEYAKLDAARHDLIKTRKADYTTLCHAYMEACNKLDRQSVDPNQGWTMLRMDETRARPGHESTRVVRYTRREPL